MYYNNIDNYLKIVKNSDDFMVFLKKVIGRDIICLKFFLQIIII